MMKGDDAIQLVKEVGHETSKVLVLAGIENKIMVPSGQSRNFQLLPNRIQPVSRSLLQAESRKSR